MGESDLKRGWICDSLFDGGGDSGDDGKCGDEDRFGEEHGDDPDPCVGDVVARGRAFRGAGLYDRLLLPAADDPIGGGRGGRSSAFPGEEDRDVVGDAGIVSRNLPTPLPAAARTDIDNGAGVAPDEGLILGPDGDEGDEPAAAAAISRTALRSRASTPEISHESNDALGSSG